MKRTREKGMMAQAAGGIFTQARDINPKLAKIKWKECKLKK